MTAQSVPQTVLDADRVVTLKVVVLRKERRLKNCQGKVIRIQGDHKTLAGPPSDTLQSVFDSVPRDFGGQTSPIT
jgi:hypothetical protein